MQPKTLNQAWVRQAQLDAERDVIECRICHRRAGLDEAITLWRNGVLVFAVCDRCAAHHDVLLHPTEAGLEVRARSRTSLIVRPPETDRAAHVRRE